MPTPEEVQAWIADEGIVSLPLSQRHELDRVTSDSQRIVTMETNGERSLESRDRHEDA